MNIEEFNRQWSQKMQQMQEFMRKQAPVLAGNIAKRHIQNDFERGGFTHNGFHPWQRTKRQQTGSGAAAGYGPLLSGRNHLMESIEYAPGDSRVVIFSKVPYAPVHNWGGMLHPNVTPRMRKYAWAMHYQEAGGDTKKDTAWKRLALTKKKKLDIRIPQRQFISSRPGPELEQKLKDILDKKIVNIIQK